MGTFLHEIRAPQPPIDDTVHRCHLPNIAILKLQEGTIWECDCGKQYQIFDEGWGGSNPTWFQNTPQQAAANRKKYSNENSPTG